MRRLVPSVCVLALLMAACGDAAPEQQDTTATAAGSAPDAAPASAELTPDQRQTVLASLPAPYASADLDNGRRVFARCRACHTINEGGRNMTGPNLWQVFGRTAGSLEDFNYSPALREAEFVWDGERLDHWLENPREFLPGNRMAFAGVRNPDERRDLIAWLMVETGYRPG